jgi:hypothetical protein
MTLSRLSIGSVADANSDYPRSREPEDLTSVAADSALLPGGRSQQLFHCDRQIADPFARRVIDCVGNRPAYFARAGEPAVPGDLHAHDAVIYTQRGGGAAWTFRREATEVSVTLEGRLRVSAAEGLCAAVLAHAGLAIASEWMFIPELAEGTVRVVLPDWELPELSLLGRVPGRPNGDDQGTYIHLQPGTHGPRRRSDLLQNGRIRFDCARCSAFRLEMVLSRRITRHQCRSRDRLGSGTGHLSHVP